MRGVAVALAALLAASASAQTGTVGGRVVDGAGSPVPGASVRIVGTELGSAAGADGRFEVPGVPAGPAELAVSSVGFTPARAGVEVPDGGRVEVVVALEEAVVETGEVVVDASRAPTATRTDAPVRLVPQAVTVVPARLLQAQMAGDVDEALRSVPGVALAGREHPYAAITVRGFAAENTSTFRRNGVEFAHYYDPMQANVERVEVLRGPASVLFGRIEPGGVINLVTERPQPRRHFEAQADVDEWGAHRYAADLTGPLTAGRTVLARVNASATRAMSWRDELGARETFVAPAITWQPRPALRLTLEGEALSARAINDPGIAIPDTTTAATSRLGSVPGAERFFGELGARYRWDAVFAMATAEVFTRRGWSVRGVGSTGRYEYERGIVQLVGMESIARVGRQYRIESTEYRYVQAEAAASGTVRTGPLSHGLTVGAEAVRLGIDLSNRAPLTERDGTLDFASIAPVDLLAPAPTGLPPSSSLVEYVFADGAGLNLGAFVQDRVSTQVGRGRLHVVASGRVSHVSAEAELFALVQTDESPAGLNHRRLSVTALTPGVAVLYEPAGWASAYASYGRSFNPVFQQVSASGEPFDPTVGEGLEAGAKAETRRFRASIAAYHLVKSGALSQLGDGSYVQTGRQRSRGLELGALAEPADGLTVTIAYAFTDAMVTADEAVPVGSRLPGAPRHAANLWAEARLPWAPVRFLSLNAGARAVSARYSSLWNTLRLPAHSTVDAGASVELGRIRLQALVENALDARYAEGADRHPDAGPAPALVVAWPGARRTLRLRMTMRL